MDAKATIALTKFCNFYIISKTGRLVSTQYDIFDNANTSNSFIVQSRLIVSKLLKLVLSEFEIVFRKPQFCLDVQIVFRKEDL